MLRELRVENYAVIDHVAVEFGPGLNLLTGETGAGKSILIDALALLLGAKASADVVRHGAERAIVSAVFEAEDGAAGRAIATILAENGLDDPGEGEVILKREILANGKGRVFVNNQPATVAVLKQLGPNLASVHAQLESILTFDSTARLTLLDRFCGSDTSELQEAFTRVREIRSKIADLERDEQDRLRLVDLWSFQKKEIEAAQLSHGEDEKLEAEKRVLANSERLFAAAMGAYGALYEDEANALALLKSAERQLEELARFDASFREAVAAITSARAAMEDVSATARAFADNLDASPEWLAEIEDRLAMIDRLKRKYGQNVAAVLAYGEDVARRLHE
ncbi:MAG: AAA family ATPase, partial [Acidobacteriales bacterium]|nr:AAA family ATPase [Terriglobales bacterium]